VAGDRHDKNSPKFEGRGALHWWGHWVATGRVCKAFRYIFIFCSSVEFNFWLPLFEEGVLYGVDDGTVAMAMVGTIWTGGCKLPLSRKWWLEMTSCRLPIVTIGLSLTVFAVLRLVTDGRQNWSCKKRHCPLQTAAWVSGVCGLFPAWLSRQRLYTLNIARQYNTLLLSPGTKHRVRYCKPIFRLIS